jgi:hypothetical protein
MEQKGKQKNILISNFMSLSQFNHAKLGGKHENQNILILKIYRKVSSKFNVLFLRKIIPVLISIIFDDFSHSLFGINIQTIINYERF